MTDGRLTDAEMLTRVSRQVIGVVLISWQRVLRASLLAATVALFVAETAACLVTGSFPPPPIAQLVVGLLALAVGYCVAATTLFALLLRGGVRFIRRLEGDITIGAEAASVFARREVGDLGAGARRVFERLRGVASAKVSPRPSLPSRPSVPSRARPATNSRPPIPARAIANPVAVAAVGLDVSRLALPRSLPTDVRRDPDDAIIRTPPPAMQSLPVLAARLPRIGWTYDEQSALGPAAPSRPASAPSVHLASQAAQAAQAVSPTTDTPLTPTTDAPAGAPLPPADVADDVPPDGADESEAPETAGRTPDAPGLIPRGWRRSDASTRPLPAITRPLPTPSGARSSALWDRVSQALVGQSRPVAQPADAEATQDEFHAEPPPVADDVAPEDAWLNG